MIFWPADVQTNKSKGKMPSSFSILNLMEKFHCHLQMLLIYVSRITYPLCAILRRKAKCEALATLRGYSGYPALDCLQQNFCQCSQSIRFCNIFESMLCENNGRGQQQASFIPFLMVKCNFILKWQRQKIETQSNEKM